LIPHKTHTLDELLILPLNEEVFDQILEILDQKHRMGLGGLGEIAQLVPA
jgi:hypothetical protein